jgi:hypothetical protein
MPIPINPQTFKDHNYAFQVLVWEWDQLRQENERRTDLAKSDPQTSQQLLMSEMAVLVMTMEAFMRIIVPPTRRRLTAGPLYKRVVRTWPPFAKYFSKSDMQAYQARRNTFLHGNFRERARQLKIRATEDHSPTMNYFLSGAFRSDLLTVRTLTDKFLAYFDPATGKPRNQGAI